VKAKISKRFEFIRIYERYKKSILLILILIFTINIVNAEESKYREEKGLQVQLLLNGGALIGYHFNDQVFLGVTSITNFNDREAVTTFDNATVQSILLEAEILPDGLYGKKYEQGRILTGQLRISPWNTSGFFISFGGYQEGSRKETLYFDERDRKIGDTTYSDTSIKIIVERDPVLAPLLGIGWNWINESGFSWGFDLTGGIINDKITKATATVLTENTSVTSGDLAIEEEKYRKSSDLSASYFTIALGMNF
tara:strand:- start:727 stop:1485 length:759 start_codon:yes stop_codon:yes gene_type:complete